MFVLAYYILVNGERESARGHNQEKTMLSTTDHATPEPLVPTHHGAEHYVSLDAIRRAAVRLHLIDPADADRLVSPHDLHQDGERRSNLFEEFFADAPAEFDTRWLRVGHTGPAVRTIERPLGRIVLVDDDQPQVWDGDIGTSEAHLAAASAQAEAIRTWYMLASVAMAYEGAALGDIMM